MTPPFAILTDVEVYFYIGFLIVAAIGGILCGMVIGEGKRKR